MAFKGTYLDRIIRRYDLIDSFLLEQVSKERHSVVEGRERLDADRRRRETTRLGSYDFQMLEVALLPALTVVRCSVERLSRQGRGTRLRRGAHSTGPTDTGGAFPIFFSFLLCSILVRQQVTSKSAKLKKKANKGGQERRQTRTYRALKLGLDAAGPRQTCGSDTALGSPRLTPLRDSWSDGILQSRGNARFYSRFVLSYFPTSPDG